MRVCQVHIWCQRRPCPPSLLSGTPNVFLVSPSRTGISGHTANHARMLKMCTLVGNQMSRTIMWLRLTHEFGGEPSMSSKSLMMTCQESNIKNNYEVKDDSYLSWIQSGTLNVLQFTDDDRVVLDTLQTKKESWNFVQKLGISYEEHLKCQGLRMSPVGNFKSPPSHWGWWGGSWHTYNHARY